jgi:hypothetical protein
LHQGVGLAGVIGVPAGHGGDFLQCGRRFFQAAGLME